jgi:hypothetical protein
MHHPRLHSPDALEPIQLFNPYLCMPFHFLAIKSQPALGKPPLSRRKSVNHNVDRIAIIVINPT